MADTKQQTNVTPTTPTPSPLPTSTTVAIAGATILDPNKRNVTFQTSMGSFTIELYWREAPRTCHNILSLAARGYYDGCIFHRVIKDFMAQTGDPTGTGRGGVSIYGKQFDDEINGGLKHMGAGIVSMANSGPNTNGSQFFVTLAPTPWLDGKHTIFGRIKSGMKMIQRIGLVLTDSTDRPSEEIKVFKAFPDA